MADKEKVLPQLAEEEKLCFKCRDYPRWETVFSRFYRRRWYWMLRCPQCGALKGVRR
jgi:hypothetical protein